MTTLAPASAQASAKARPSPRPPPVTTMIRSASDVMTSAGGEVALRQVVQDAGLDAERRWRRATRPISVSSMMTTNTIGVLAWPCAEGQQIAKPDIAADQLADHARRSPQA